ncbi:MAG: hypothetical protein O7E52_05960 [Candidatus Poribacteria bacterium]|nr:hypothetical protein [Candidatus Poribacteria bacterium]
MNLVFVGCEYAGKSTLAAEVMKWAEKTLGGTSHFHDHFSVPSSELTPEAQASLLTLHPQALEMLQRYMIEYHISEAFYRNPDHNLMGLVIEEAVYAPLYYGYGGKDSGAPFRSPEGQRTEMARRTEEKMLQRAPDTVLVLFKAASAVIAKRMKENPHTHQIVQEQDIEYVLKRFEAEFEASLIQKRIVIDTTSATVAETLAEFVEKYEPYHTNADLLRIRKHRAAQRD